MKRPDPGCSIMRAGDRLAARKAAALNTEVGGAPGFLPELEAARAFTSGTDLDPRDLLAVSKVATMSLLDELATLPAELALPVIRSFLMDAIAAGYHARLLEQESEVSA